LPVAPVIAHFSQFKTKSFSFKGDTVMGENIYSSKYLVLRKTCFAGSFRWCTKKKKDKERKKDLDSLNINLKYSVRPNEALKISRFGLHKAAAKAMKR
jgi:hypothetical protein